DYRDAAPGNELSVTDVARGRQVQPPSVPEWDLVGTTVGVLWKRWPPNAFSEVVIASVGSWPAVGWPPSGKPKTKCSPGASRSRCCIPTSPATTPSAPGSGAKR